MSDLTIPPDGRSESDLDRRGGRPRTGTDGSGAEHDTPSGRAHRPGGGVARGPVLIVVVAILVVAGLIDRTGGAGRRAGATPIQPVPVAAPDGALSSSWFCAGATDTTDGPAPGRVVIANSSAHALAGTVTMVPSQGARVVVGVTVEAGAFLRVVEAVPGGAPWIGAIVDLDGGGASVEQQLDGTLGVVATPCATSGSTAWYFSSGATLVNAGVEISLLNPYPAEAIVDLSFSTEQGDEDPGDFQGIAVPAGGLVSLDLGSHLRRRMRIATTVSARSGRVVAWKTDVVSRPTPGEALLGGPASATGSTADPAAPVPGVTLVLGAPSPADGWSWPDGQAGGGIDESYVIYNPGVATAQVRLHLILDQGSADPFDITVAPGGVSTVVASAEARVPAGVGHAAVLQSLNGVPVVAERTVAAGAPSSRQGLGELLGARLAAPEWLFGAAGTDPATDEWVVVFNPGPVPVKVAVGRVGAGFATPLTGAAGVELGPDRRSAFEVSGTTVSNLEVQASGPVVAERDLYSGPSALGYALALGVPLSPGSRR